GAAAVDVADVKLGGSLHRRGKNNLSAVGRPSGRDVGASETGERDELPGIHGIHADLRAVDAFIRREASEGDARAFGRPAGCEGDGVKVGDLVLIGAVVIHDPDFLDACATGANESDLRGGDAGQAARKFADDFVCKLMREFANLQVGGTAAI